MANHCGKCLHLDVCKTAETCDGHVPRCKYFINKNSVMRQECGRWIIKDTCNHVPWRLKNPEKWVTYKCSRCGYSSGRKRSNYCPNCGVRMDGDSL